MESILSRLYRIARAAIPRPWVHSSVKTSGPAGAKTESCQYGKTSGADGGKAYSETAYASRESARNNFGALPSEVVEDLALFDLGPPSSLDEIRKARNREMKKYHSDRFLNDPVRLETSKRIMQIYNAAYDRLEVYYREKA